MNAEPSRPSPARRRSPLAWLLLGFVRIYQATAPLRGPRCRFYPTCSAYAVEAIRVHGGFRGFWLAARRVGRCHPWNPGGVDYVPVRHGRQAVDAEQTSTAFVDRVDTDQQTSRTDEVAGTDRVAHQVPAASSARRK